MRFSASGLKLFENCPGAFGLKYVDKLSEDDNYFARVGRMVHEMIDKHPYDPAMPLESFQPNDGGYAEAVMLYNHWREKFAPGLDDQNLLQKEELVEMKFGDHDIAFRMDRCEDVGGFLTLTDWKSGFKFLTKEEMLKDIQVRLYCVAALKLYPNYQDIVFQIGHVRSGQYQYLELERSEVEPWEDSIRATIAVAYAHTQAKEKKEKGALPYTPGKFCENCGYFKDCKPGKEASAKALKHDGTKPIIPKNITSAVTLAGKLALVERYLSDAKKALKEWVKNRGSVTSGDQTWGFWPSNGLEIDVDMIPAELNEEVAPYMELAQGKKSKIWANTALLEKLKKAGALRPTSSVRFDGKKAGEVEDAP